MPTEQKKNNKGILFGVIGLIVVAVVAAFVFLKGDTETAESSAQTAVVTPVEEAVPENGAAEETSNSESAVQAATEAVDVGDGIKVEPGNPVVAKVDGKEITRVDVYRFIQTMPANIQQLPATAVYPMALEQVVNTRIVQNKAEESNVEETDEFKLELEMAKQQLERNVYLQNQVDKKITDGKLKSAYNEYIKKVPDVEERRARHILLEDESKAVPEFSKSVFSMSKGDVTEAPVKTQFGYHVIKLEDVRKRPKPTMEQLTPALEAEMRRELLTEMMQDWRKSAKIEQFDINGKPLKEGANALGIVPPATSTN